LRGEGWRVLAALKYADADHLAAKWNLQRCRSGFRADLGSPSAVYDKLSLPTAVVPKTAPRRIFVKAAELTLVNVELCLLPLDDIANIDWQVDTREELSATGCYTAMIAGACVRASAERSHTNGTLGAGFAGRISQARPHLSRSRRSSFSLILGAPPESSYMLRPDTIALTALLALLTAFGPVATDMYVPSMPDIGRSFGATASSVQLTLSAYLVAFAAGQVIYGPISDRFGRKPVLLGALVLFCIASLACAVASSIEMLIAARAFQALGGCGAIVLPRAVVRDLYAGDRAGRELSRMGAIMSFAPVIAPLIGAVVQAALGWHANFLIIVAVGLVATVIAWRSMPETLHHRSATPISIASILQSYRAITANRSFLAHLGIVACSYAGLFAWISGSPFVLQNLYGLSPVSFGIAFAVASIGSLTGGAIATSLVTRIGLDRTIGFGTLALAAGGLSMVAGQALNFAPIGSLVVSMVVYQIGLMLAMPQAIAGALSPFPDRAGTASSLVGVAQQVSAALLGTVVGHAVGHSAWPLAGAIAVMGCLSFVLWAGSRRLRAEGAHVAGVRFATIVPPRLGGLPFESAVNRRLSVTANAGQ
jgi:MFS transporter, DHA1 family, multidrug resistance protein